MKGMPMKCLPMRFTPMRRTPMRHTPKRFGGILQISYPTNSSAVVDLSRSELQNSVGAGGRLVRHNLEIFGVGASEINVYVRGSLIVVMYDRSFPSRYRWTKRQWNSLV